MKRPRGASLRWPNMPAPVWGSQDTKPRDTSAWVDPDPDPEETDLPASPDVIAMLGFDPDAVEDSTDDDAEPAGAADAEWDESKHKRGQPGNAGQFGSGGGKANPTAATTLKPHTNTQSAALKKLHTIATEGVMQGADLDDLAAAIKQHTANYKHSTIASYGNTVLAHLEKMHGLKPGSLGKAVTATVAGSQPSPLPVPFKSPKSMVQPPPAQTAGPQIPAGQEGKTSYALG